MSHHSTFVDMFNNESECMSKLAAKISRRDIDTTVFFFCCPSVLENFRISDEAT